MVMRRNSMSILKIPSTITTVPVLKDNIAIKVHIWQAFKTGSSPGTTRLL